LQQSESGKQNQLKEFQQTLAMLTWCHVALGFVSWLYLHALFCKFLLSHASSLLCASLAPHVIQATTIIIIVLTSQSVPLVHVSRSYWLV